MATGKTTFADELNWYGLVASGVVLCKDGSFIAGWHLTGIDTEALDAETMDAKAEGLARAVSSFSNGEAFWVDLARRPQRDYRSNEMDFPAGPLRELEREREAWFKRAGTGNYANTLTLVYQWQPPFETDLEATIATFEESCRAVEDRFGALFRLRRLAAAEEEVGLEGDHALRDGLLGRLASGVTGRFRKVNIPKIPVYLDVILAPEWEHANPVKLPVISGRPTAIIAIDGYPDESSPEMLATLEGLSCEYQWTTRFMPMSVNKARAEIGRRRAAWGQAKSNLQAQMGSNGRGAVSSFGNAMEAEALAAHEAAEAGLTRFGFFNTTVSLFGEVGEDERVTRQRANMVIEMLGELGYPARLETYNAFDAFVATLPGHRQHNARRAILSARNFADLIPVKTIWSGEAFAPCDKFPAKAPALIRARSKTGEPYFFNLHSGDVGHSLVFGPTGAGKSVLLGLIAANFLKYPGAQVFVFDKGGSMKALTHAVGGAHYTLGEQGAGAGLAPLKATATLGLDWAETWLTALVEFGKVEITQEIRREIASGLAASTDLDGDALTNFAHQVQSAPVREAIDPWINDGVRAGLLNAETDEVKLSPFTVFETEHLFEVSEEAGLLTLDYLFRMIEKRLTGAPTLILLDEAWTYLGHDFFAARIKRWLRELRKSNASVVIATQFIADAIKSGLSDALLQSCPTRIFLPDAGAKASDATNWYHSLGLTSRQIDLLASMQPKRDYYVVKPQGSRVVDFAIQPRSLALLGATDTEASRAAEALAKLGGGDWWRDFIEDRLRKGEAHA